MIKAGDLMRFTNAKVESMRAVREEREKVGRALIETLDSFDDALHTMRRSPAEEGLRPMLEGWVEGFAIFPRRLLAVLKELGIEEIEVSAGDDYDPQTMEIFFIEFTEDEEKWGTVEGVYRRGFRRDAKLWPGEPAIWRGPRVRVWGAHPEEP